MRNIAVSLTKPQILAQTKLVTRRVGWLWLVEASARGEQPLLQPVEKCMGLKRGEKILRVGPPIRVLSALREPLRALLDDVVYGLNEIAREGFASHPELQWPSAWVPWFCSTHRGCTPESEVTRIKFEYLNGKAHPTAAKTSADGDHYPSSSDMVCHDCYRKATGSLPCRFACWFNGKCGVCGKEMRLTYLENDDKSSPTPPESAGRNT